MFGKANVCHNSLNQPKYSQQKVDTIVIYCIKSKKIHLPADVPEMRPGNRYWKDEVE